MASSGARPDALVRIFGVRHHGPGSARSLRRALEEMSPDLVLVEGPPDAQDVLHLAAHEDMRPPVALLVHAADDPSSAVFHPYASFSPEWIAIRHGLERGVPVRFFDLPHAHQFALGEDAGGGEEAAAPADAARRDPLGALAAAAGEDGERWWDRVLESRHGDAAAFDAVAEAMTELRANLHLDLPPPEARREALREAWMRRALRAARKEGFTRIAACCGAWHVPALQEPVTARHDDELLKGMPRVRTEAAWAPWTHERLAAASGYRAGIASPEWYALLFSGERDVAAAWLTRAARLLREADVDCSSGHVIEGVRLAEALAALRERSLPGLDELQDAALAVLCSGQRAPLALVERRLVIGTSLGAVPTDAPATPLQRDLARLQKSLRLKPSADEQDVELDLRKPVDLDRSRLLHRLLVLDVPWGRPGLAARRSKGTFAEPWRLQWQPDLAVALVVASRWGATVEAAATSRARAAADESRSLAELVELLDRVLHADLPPALDPLVLALDARASASSDVPQLLDALRPLADVLRYGSVRGAPGERLEPVFSAMLARASVGLPGACAGLADEAADALARSIDSAHAAVRLLERPALEDAWLDALAAVEASDSAHPRLRGRATRSLRESGRLVGSELARRVSLATSRAVEPGRAAAWLEGFLAGSGLALAHDEELFACVDDWLSGLGGEAFVGTLPLVRRTFATFPAATRREIGERVARGASAAPAARAADAGFDEERAARAVRLAVRLLGLERVEDPA